MRQRRPRERPTGARKPATPDTGIRVHKLLAAAGIGSRREIERWIREGRLRINGEAAALGARLGARDRITLDGRPVRLRGSDKQRGPQVLLFHRSPGTALDIRSAASRAADHTSSARAAAGRWLAVQPMPPVDGGLEILVNDGSWAHRISRGAHALTVDYLLRVRGGVVEALMEEFRAATRIEDEPLTILKADAQYGAGLNHWLSVTVRATRPAPVRHWWAARGIIVSRLMRVRIGPIHLSRELPRGHSRAMTPGERGALEREIELAAAPDRSAAALGGLAGG